MARLSPRWEHHGVEQDRSPKVECSRREQSVSRERWMERTRDRDEARDSRREPKGRDRDRNKDRERERDVHGSGSRAWRDKADEHPSCGREDDKRDPNVGDRERERDVHGSGSHAWRDKADEHPSRGCEDDERDPDVGGNFILSPMNEPFSSKYSDLSSHFIYPAAYPTATPSLSRPPF
ncbi:hypothetical protein JB92DRAFT_3107525 [Gautieria morchelliformis]|nr:hypothetical protein JB92DRAFT_3107525 [Gautieria morchelliformis]